MTRTKRLGLILVAAVVLGTTGMSVMNSAEVSVAGDLADARHDLAGAGPASMITRHLPADYRSLSPAEAARRLAADPELASRRGQAEPDPDAADPLESGLAKLRSTTTTVDSAEVARVFEVAEPEAVSWLAVTFPDAIGNLSGAPLDDRVAANRIRVTAAVEESRHWPVPPRPWTEDRQRAPRGELVALTEPDRRLIYFDPAGNGGEGSWIEVIGDLDEASSVGVLVPGGSAFLTSENFTRYSHRASTFVDAANGELAMVVWAGSSFPTGWIHEASSSWSAVAAPKIADFTRDLGRQLGDDTSIVLAGHSYGGAMVGEAELYPMPVDRVLHVASAGAGFGVDSPHDYLVACRDRFVMMAPGDPIGYVQDIPSGTGLGHGVSTVDLAGAQRIETGRLPADPDALDDVGRTLGSQGIAGKQIGGVHAHSEVFIPFSDAWRNLLAVLTMKSPTLTDSQPEPLEECGEAVD